MSTYVYPGSPNELTTSEMAEEIKKFMINGRRMKVPQDAEAIAISRGLQVISMKKLSARWVPKLLLMDIKTTCVNFKKYLAIGLIFGVRTYLLIKPRFIIAHAKPKKIKTVFRRKFAQEKAKATLYTNNVIGTLFRDICGVIHVYYPENVS